MYFPINLKTHFSILNSVNKPKDLISTCKNLGFSSCGLSDIDSMSGAVQFFIACKQADIKPILGCQLKEENLGYINLVARNLSGYRALLKLIHIHSIYGIIKKKDLESVFDNNLFVIIGGGYEDSVLNNSLIPDWSSQFAKRDSVISVSPDWLTSMRAAFNYACDAIGIANVFVGVNNLNSSIPVCRSKTELLRAFCHDYPTKSVAVGNNICQTIDENTELRILLCTKNKTTFSTINKFNDNYFDEFSAIAFRSNNNFILEHSDFCNIHQEHEIKNLDTIEYGCESYDILNQPQLPDFNIESNEKPDEYFRQLCREGWRKKIKGKVDDEQKYGDRVKYEMAVLNKNNLIPYFLIVQDYVNKAKQRGELVGVGRGSAAGCLVSYLVGITGIDPLKHGLLFERFYNDGRNSPGKISLPDIDVDFMTDKRIDTLEYIKQKYGQDRFGQLATFHRFKGKEALKNVLRVHNSCSFHEMNEITDNIPDESKISDELEEMMNETGEKSIIRWALENNADALTEWCHIIEGGYDGNYWRQFSQAIKIEGIIRGYGAHASGYIISRDPLDETCPLIPSKSKSELMVGYEMNDAAAVGLCKFDLLGTSVLDRLNSIMMSVNP